VQKYTLGFHEVLRLFNTLPPSIEPTATGHISEQIEMVKKIIDNGFAYEANGTVYFDVDKYVKNHDYTVLTNRKLEDLLNGTRELGGQDEKKGRLDFALWIKAKPEHIMQWPAPWSVGFPGWHIECSAMSSKYLGAQFDIHGGGMDLAATHHTNEIAQSEACNHVHPAKYWMHTNMLTVNGSRMSKSAGNGFLPHELFTGNHPLLTRGYSPMAVRFFMMQAHYRSTLDFSNDALDAADKGYKRLMSALALLDKIEAGDKADANFSVADARSNCYAAMDDDFNSPVLIAELFEVARYVNSVYDGKASIDAATLAELKQFTQDFVFDVLGLKDDTLGADADSMDELMQIIIDIRNEAKKNKDFTTSDKIREELTAIGIQLKDSKEGTLWNKI